MKVGVLDIQGDVAEHVRALTALGAEVVRVKRPSQLDGLSGLIIPGGESTTIGKLMREYGLIDAVRQRCAEGMAVFGTCAGAILVADHIMGSDPPGLCLMNMRVQRNAYGRQRESFETGVPVDGIPGEPVKAVFIRAPIIEDIGPGAQVLARHRGEIVMARQGRVLAGTFHPELTDDDRVHRYFLQMCAEPQNQDVGA